MISKLRGRALRKTKVESTYIRSKRSVRTASLLLYNQGIE
jgi:hypothetical protein